MNSLDLVLKFHDAFKIPLLNEPGIPDQERIDLRIKLLEEEFDELKQAFAERDLQGVLDALTDIQYVLDGTYLECGMYGALKDAALKEVHDSNMSKLDENGQPIINDGLIDPTKPVGKVLKSANYWPPDLARVITDYRAKVAELRTEFENFPAVQDHRP